VLQGVSLQRFAFTFYLLMRTRFGDHTALFLLPSPPFPPDDE